MKEQIQMQADTNSQYGSQYHGVFTSEQLIALSLPLRVHSDLTLYLTSYSTTQAKAVSNHSLFCDEMKQQFAVQTPSSEQRL
jgi:hypothetical protein